MYTTAVPPAALQFSSIVGQQSSPQQKTCTSALNFRKVHCLMNALKGDDLLYTERMEVVESIKALDSAGRADLVDFLSSKNAAISATMENNACKHFVCTPEELTNVLSVRTINDLLDFWSFVLLQIVPTFSSLTYPLEDDTFQVRPCILTALRDKVLLPILRNRNLSSDDGARIRPILAHVCFATADHSQKHQEFVELSDRILFNINSRLDNEVKIREPAQHSKKEQVVHTLSTQNINRTPSNIHTSESSTGLSQKPRSKTLPKSVSWVVKIDDTEASNC